MNPPILLLVISIWAFDKGELINKKKDGVKTAVSNLTLDKTAVEQIYQIMKKDMAVTKETQACPSLISSIEVVLPLLSVYNYVQYF